jgi:hypothetical protein
LVKDKASGYADLGTEKLVFLCVHVRVLV